VLGTGQAGNGLGLSIVARIAALHDAALSFEDGLDGQGLSVVLDFPPNQVS
jgi:two-component system sensor histidine kinase QseC